MKTYRSFMPLIALVLLLTGYNFIGAAWAPPSATPPNNNTPAPINLGPDTQAKTGNFMANIVAAATSTWSPRYCDELGNNCWDPSTGAPGGGGGTSTITVGGQCFEPAWAVTCNWNWSGDGNDNSTYIVPTFVDPGSSCARYNRSYQYHNMVLAKCFAPSTYAWSVGAYSCSARTPSSCETTTGVNTRSVTCQDQYGQVVADSNCPAPKPATNGGSCSRRGGGSDC